LTNVPLHRLHIADQEENIISPYSQILFIDYDHVSDITVQDIKQYPIVIDSAGWIIDGNHRAVAAKQLGLKSIPAWQPVVDEEEETYDQFMARRRAEKGLDENFADGKKPGRKGLAKRSGVNCKQSVTKLRSIAKNSSGEKQRMAHWCANMKSGKKK
jgi:hypothetical protein